MQIHFIQGHIYKNRLAIQKINLTTCKIHGCHDYEMKKKLYYVLALYNDIIPLRMGVTWVCSAKT